ncbi:MAG: MFS transporter [Bacteroidetes bacterium]|nr:MFS transporter [Bacteroidota bacterium]MDA1121275.1 MFS transporter [Bacteroidota bacterium]
MIETPTQPKSALAQILSIPVIVAALGYMVDMYDLFLFSIVRVPSLVSLGLVGDQLLDDGIMLLNIQMAGILIGGVFWGVMGDKKGRLSVLFGSIIIYSLANIGNGMVTTVEQYAVLRFIAGVGLAGELGAGITLVTEILPKEIRGYGTTLVATMGVFGAILAFVIADTFDWRMSYYIGGGLGLVLLVMRVGVFESGMYTKAKSENVVRGSMMMLFGNRARVLKYLQSILIGLPIWFVVGVLITFSPEFGIALGLSEPVVAGKAVLFAFSGQVSGNILSGYLSQYFKSRRKIIFTFILMMTSLILVYILVPLGSTAMFYILCGGLGFCSGYWTLFITVAAELFGTNLRATVATTVPNFVRGAIIPIIALFTFFRGMVGLLYGALIVGMITVVLALLALKYLEETYSKDLDYSEE